MKIEIGTSFFRSRIVSQNDKKNLYIVSVNPNKPEYLAYDGYILAFSHPKFFTFAEDSIVAFRVNKGKGSYVSLDFFEDLSKFENILLADGLYLEHSIDITRLKDKEEIINNYYLVEVYSKINWKNWKKSGGNGRFKLFIPGLNKIIISNDNRDAYLTIMEQLRSRSDCRFFNFENIYNLDKEINDKNILIVNILNDDFKFDDISLFEIILDKRFFSELNKKCILNGIICIIVEKVHGDNIISCEETRDVHSDKLCANVINITDENELEVVRSTNKPWSIGSVLQGDIISMLI